jgi:ribose 5-phosphate isomerase B
VAEVVNRGRCQREIVLGGSGNGEAIVANRVSRVRCSLCWNPESARLARAHNDANIVALGERLLTQAEALAIFDTWMATGFEDGRHLHRINSTTPEKRRRCRKPIGTRIVGMENPRESGSARRS